MYEVIGQMELPVFNEDELTYTGHDPYDVYEDYPSYEDAQELCAIYWDLTSE